MSFAREPRFRSGLSNIAQSRHASDSLSPEERYDPTWQVSKLPRFRQAAASKIGSSAASGTPLKHALPGSQMPAAQKAAVRENSPCPGHCLFCGISIPFPEVAHVMPAELAGYPELIEHLGKCLGYEDGEFNIHTHTNGILLCPNDHTLYDRKKRPTVVPLLPMSVLTTIRDYLKGDDIKVKNKLVNRTTIMADQVFTGLTPFELVFLEPHWPRGRLFTRVLFDKKKGVYDARGKTHNIDPLVNKITLHTHANAFFMAYKAAKQIEYFTVHTPRQPYPSSVKAASDILQEIRLYMEPSHIRKPHLKTPPKAMSAPAKRYLSESPSPLPKNSKKAKSTANTSRAGTSNLLVRQRRG